MFRRRQPGSRRTWLRYAAYLILLCLAALWLGGDDVITWGLRAIAERTLHAELDLDGVRYNGTSLRIARVAIYDPSDASRTNPLLVAEGVNVRVGRRVEAITLDRATINWWRDGYLNNAAFITKLSQAKNPPPSPAASSTQVAPAKPRPRWLPRTLEIRRVETRLGGPESGVRMTELGPLLATFDGLDTFGVVMRSTNARGQGWLKGVGDAIPTADTGTVSIAMTRGGGAWTFNDFTFACPGLMDIAGGMDMKDGDTNLRLRTCDASGKLMNGLLGLFPSLKIQCDGLSAPEGVTVRIGAKNFRLESPEIRVPGLIVASGDTSFVSANVTAKSRSGKSPDTWIWDIKTDGGIKATVSGVDSLTAIRRVGLEALIPRAAVEKGESPFLSAPMGILAGLGSMKASGTLERPEQGWRLDLALRPKAIAQGKGPVPVFEINAGFGAPGVNELVCDIKPYGEKRVGSLRASMGSEGLDSIRFECKPTSLTPFTRFMGSKWPEGFLMEIGGRVDLKKTKSGYAGDMDLQLADLAIGGSPLDPAEPVALRGPIAWRTDSKQLSASKMTVSWASASASFRDATLQTTPLRFTGKVKANLAPDDIPSLSDHAIWGTEVVFDGKMTYRDGAVSANGAFKGKGLGYAGFAAKPATEVSIKGGGVYDIAKRRLSLDALEGAWGASTFNLGACVFAGGGADWSMPFTLETDLTPFVELSRYTAITAVEGGSGRFEGVIHRRDGRVEFEARGDARAAQLTLGGKWATLQEVSIKGGMSRAQEVTGEGVIQASNLAAFGFPFTTVSGDWRGDGPNLLLTIKETGLLNGGLNGTAQVDLLGASRAGSFKASINKIDLAEFTRVFDPPRTRLEGLASGDFEIHWGDRALQDMHLSLDAPDGLTVNKDLLQSLLVSDITKGVSMRKQIIKALDKALGKAPQTPYERGSLTMDYVDKRYHVKAHLDRRDFKPDFDIKIDEQEVVEFLKMRQKGQFEALSMAPEE